MCYKKTCRKCGKATWGGCGQHIEQALAGVPQKDRCQGHQGEPGGGFFSRLLGR